MKDKACKDCKWWMEIDKGKKSGNIGECCRYPPKHAASKPGVADKWTKTFAMDYCGEFVENQ